MILRVGRVLGFYDESVFESIHMETVCTSIFNTVMKGSHTCL